MSTNALLTANVKHGACLNPNKEIKEEIKCLINAAGLV